MLGPLLASHRGQLKPEAVWEIEAGASLTSADVARAMTRHATLLDRFRQFQETYEFVVCAVSQVPPFDASADWPHEINGIEMQTYIEWMKSAYWITATFCPAISVPAGSSRRACRSVYSWLGDAISVFCSLGRGRAGHWHWYGGRLFRADKLTTRR
jgi:amidase